MNEIRIMLIDDEASVLAALQRMLRQRLSVPGQAMTVCTYSSPLAAIDAVQERSVDVVVCDFRMPELDGVETLRRIKDLQPQTGRILLSGSREFDTVVDAVNVAQVCRIVLKPWEETELVQAVRDAVETRRLRIENAELADQVRVQRGLLTQQEAELRRIEHLWPGITRVEWGADGSVRICDTDVIDSDLGP